MQVGLPIPPARPALDPAKRPSISSVWPNAPLFGEGDIHDVLHEAIQLDRL
jgi:hypothetical protein